MKKIYIDPGHGSFVRDTHTVFNPGATYKNRMESQDVYTLAAEVAKKLARIPGVSVNMSRSCSEDPDISYRASEANSWGADYFISIHRNAFKPNSASGVEAWIYSKAATNGDAWTKAERIVDGVCKATGLTNRGIHKGAPSYADFGVNKLTRMTSCLLEVGFVDNDRDNAAFDEHFDAMAEAIAKGLCQAVGVQYLENGDVDGDGDVDVTDARAALRAAVGLEKLDTTAEKRADVNGDGKVDVSDARDILRKATGLDT